MAQRGQHTLHLPWIVALLSLLLTAIATGYVLFAAGQADASRFESAVLDHLHQLERRVETHKALLRSGAAFHAGTDAISAEAWRDYVAVLQIQEKYPGIQGFGWAPRFLDEEAFTREMRQVHADFRVWPPSQARLRTSIAFLEPLDRRNRAAIGYDMYAEEVRREAMDRAIDTGDPALSGRVRLMQEIDPPEQPGFLIYVPVFEPPLPADPGQRMERLRGFVYAPFRARDFFEAVWEPGGAGQLGFDVYDGARPTAESVLHRSGVRRPEARHRQQVPLEVAGRIWTMEVWSQPAFEALSGRVLAWPVGLGGLLFTGILFRLTAAEGRARQEAEQSAEDARVSEAALRQSERRFRTLVEQSPLSIQIFSPDGETVQTNRAWERLWGVSLQQIGAYNILSDPQLEAQGIAALVREAFAGHPRALPTIPYSPPTGPYEQRPRYVRAFIYPVLDEAEQVREVVLVHQDVTEQHEAEQALQQAQKMESIGILAGGVAHDFNNLLTGIIGFASLAARKVPEDGDAHRLLQQLLQSAGSAADLTRQLLAYAGKGTFFLKQVDMGALVRDTWGLLHASLPRTIELEMDVGDEPLPVDADGSQIQQLVMNLVLNGAEAIGEERPGTIRVRSRRRHVDADLVGRDYPAFDIKPGDYVELAVEDDGVGMDAETLKRIFEPFFTTKFLGRGLGLAAALGIVRAHGGGLRVESRPGEGSRFTVLLPLSRAERPGPPRARGTEDLTGEGTVLVVDDEPMVRQIARTALEEQGYKVIEAANGVEALERLQGAAVDLVLLDMTMPVMGGAEVLRHMKEQGLAVRVLATSGYGEDQAMRRFAEDGVEAFVQKPYTPEALARAVKRVLGT